MGTVRRGDAQQLAFLAIVEQIQETFGDSTLLKRAYTVPQGQGNRYVSNAEIRSMLTRLSQVDAFALNHGQAGTQS